MDVSTKVAASPVPPTPRGKSVSTGSSPNITKGRVSAKIRIKDKFEAGAALVRSLEQMDPQVVHVVHAPSTGRDSDEGRDYVVVRVGGKNVRPRVNMRTEKALQYRGRTSIDDFVRVVNFAPPMQLLETERTGIQAAFLGDMADRMDISYSHLAETVGIPKATAARKLAKNEMIDGAAAIALARLLAIANEIVEDSTSAEAKNFDTAKWLGQWLDRPQKALGGCKPSELLDTQTGVAMVTKVLGAIRSGAYQ